MLLSANAALEMPRREATPPLTALGVRAAFPSWLLGGGVCFLWCASAAAAIASMMACEAS